MPSFFAENILRREQPSLLEENWLARPSAQSSNGLRFLELVGRYKRSRA
jgi:hypothetical protein